MHRNVILNLLAVYPITYPEDKINLEKTRRFIEENPGCFDSTLPPGHITGSAWIVSQDRGHVLLTHHQKLNRWLQLGGHADGNPDVFSVALREAQEESGLEKITPLSKEIFDIDVHLIPATPKQAVHYHYDIRFIFEADPTDPLVISRESKDLAWIPVAKIQELNPRRSILRMVEKLRTLSF